MDSLFSKYIAEREGLEIYLHDDKGFMTFRMQGEDGSEFYIKDMYVSPEFRRQRISFEMADRVFAIAKNRGCKYVAGTLYRGASGNSESLKAMLAYGFEIHSWDADRVVLVKGL